MQWQDRDVAAALQNKAFAGDAGRARSAVEELQQFAKDLINKVGTDLKHELKLSAPKQSIKQTQKVETPKNTHKPGGFKL